MESHPRWFPVSGSPAGRAGADAQRARDLAAAEICAAIALVAQHTTYRVALSGMATDPALVSELDEVATDAGVVLERRIRIGGGLDVVVRSRADRRLT
jgi:hypothetical protein